MTTGFIPMEDLKPKFQDQPMRYNNWYFVVQFSHQGQDCIAKFALTEGNLLQQGNQIFFIRIVKLNIFLIVYDLP